MPSQAQQSNGSPHPIQVLLARYPGMVPPDNDVRVFLGSPEAQKAVVQVLSTPKHQESWPGAIVALGMISNLSSSDVKASLLHFMESTDPFGCSSGCQSLNFTASASLQHWDTEARLLVPKSLGYLLRNTQTPAGDLAPSSPAATLLRRLGEIANGAMSTAPSCLAARNKERDESCVQRLEINAVQGLEVSAKHAAYPVLLEISTKSSNPLVAREAALAAKSIPHPPAKQ